MLERVKRHARERRILTFIKPRLTCRIQPCASPLAFGLLFRSRDRVGRDGRKGRGRGKEGLAKLAKVRLVR